MFRTLRNAFIVLIFPLSVFAQRSDISTDRIRFWLSDVREVSEEQFDFYGKIERALWDRVLKDYQESEFTNFYGYRFRSRPVKNSKRNARSRESGKIESNQRAVQSALAEEFVVSNIIQDVLGTKPDQAELFRFMGFFREAANGVSYSKRGLIWRRLEDNPQRVVTARVYETMYGQTPADKAYVGANIARSFFLQLQNYYGNSLAVDDGQTAQSCRSLLL